MGIFEQILNYGIMVVISGVFILMSVAGFKRMLRSFDRGFKEIGAKLDNLKSTIESQRNNHLSYDMAKDVIEQTYFGTMMRIQEEIMRILLQNHIDKPERRDFISQSMYDYVENLEQNDFNYLKNLYYKDRPLCNVMGTNAEEITDQILDMMFTTDIPTERLRMDLYKQVNTIFNKLTNSAIGRLPS